MNTSPHRSAEDRKYNRDGGKTNVGTLSRLSVVLSKNDRETFTESFESTYDQVQLYRNASCNLIRNQSKLIYTPP